MKFSYNIILLTFFFSFPYFVLAGYQYTPIQAVIIPGGRNLYNGNILQYLANIYTFAIAIAGGLAVMRIVYAGIKYMTSDSYGLKTEAKQQIRAALAGLLMALGSYVFLYTLNPNLVKFKLNIGRTNALVGGGADLFTNQTTGTVSGGRPSTPGVNNVPNTPGAEIVPALPEDSSYGGDPSGPDGSLLPPRQTPYTGPDSTNDSSGNTGNDTSSSNNLPTYNLNEGSSNNQTQTYTDGPVMNLNGW